MGAIQSFLQDIATRFSGLQERRILLLGLDAAGKTTLLYSLKLNECVHSIPTVGFNVEHIEYKKLQMTMWDVGGQDKIRRLWRHYYEGSDALIYVVDSSDAERLGEAATELHKILQDDSVRRSCRSVLVYANKQDLPNAMPTSKIVDVLNMRGIRGMDWYCQGSNATKGEGLYEGLDWLNNTLKSQK